LSLDPGCSLLDIVAWLSSRASSDQRRASSVKPSVHQSIDPTTHQSQKLKSRGISLQPTYHQQPSEKFSITPPDAAIWKTLEQNVKAITLDLWGTLFDDNHAPSDTIVYSERRQNFLREELRKTGNVVDPEKMKAAYKCAWVYFDEMWAQQRAFEAADGVREMLRVLDATLPPDNLSRVVKFFEEVFVGDMPPQLDDSMATVNKLATVYPLALISDTAWTPGRVMRGVMESYGTLDCFRATIFSGEVGVTKPHSKMFHLALERLGVKPNECMHVGDLHRTDIAGAKAVGMHTAWICRPQYAGAWQEDAGPEVIVRSVKEFAERLMNH
jgi:putative hydrolase of the HAD superfamily